MNPLSQASKTLLLLSLVSQLMFYCSVKPVLGDIFVEVEDAGDNNTSDVDLSARNPQLRLNYL
jgi:hypothetical protein